MFVRAIETAGAFTRAIHYISRNYQSDVIAPGTATLFFVNGDGWALTCGHVVDMIRDGDELCQKREAFRKELEERLRGGAKRKPLEHELEQKYQWSKNKPFELWVGFVGCIEGPLEYDVIRHPSSDVALLRFRNFTRLLCESFPTFASDDAGLKPGKFLCRLGYPFPEFNNYEYDKDADAIRFTESGRRDSVFFPIEGMVTRHLTDDAGEMRAFEMSTPGLRGHSGGPAFDADGVVRGMLIAASHLDMQFEIDQEVIRDSRKARAHCRPFFHVRQCIPLSLLKTFMRENGVAFQEG